MVSTGGLLDFYASVACGGVFACLGTLQAPLANDKRAVIQSREGGSHLLYGRTAGIDEDVVGIILGCCREANAVFALVALSLIGGHDDTSDNHVVGYRKLCLDKRRSAVYNNGVMRI